MGGYPQFSSSHLTILAYLSIECHGDLGITSHQSCLEFLGRHSQGAAFVLDQVLRRVWFQLTQNKEHRGLT
jgi:hypothetical protein